MSSLRIADGMKTFKNCSILASGTFELFFFSCWGEIHRLAELRSGTYPKRTQKDLPDHFFLESEIKKSRVLGKAAET